MSVASRHRRSAWSAGARLAKQQVASSVHRSLDGVRGTSSIPIPEVIALPHPQNALLRISLEIYARAIAELQAKLKEAWESTPLKIHGLHDPGCAERSGSPAAKGRR